MSIFLGDQVVLQCNVFVVAKRCVLEQKLILTAWRRI